MCEPLTVEVAVPLIPQEPLSPLEYAREEGTGGASVQAMVRSDADANVAWAAAETVIVLDAVEVRPHASVKDHVSV